MRADVVRGCDRRAWFFFNGDSGAVSAGAITGFCEPASPSVQISVIRRGQTAPFFNIKKDDRLLWKAFALGNGSRVVRVESSFLHGYRFTLEFATQRAAI